MRLVKTYQPNLNFWEINPQLTLINPYKTIWKKDRTKNKAKSSDLAWAVFLYAETSQNTIFSRYNQDERKVILEEEFNVKLDSPIAKELIEFYENNCLDDIEKQLKDYEDFLKRRTAYILSQDWNLETASELDRAASQSKKIWDDYIKIKKEFDAHQEKAHIEGNRQMSALEEGVLSGK